jgi:molecular chaperone Hsp33
MGLDMGMVVKKYLSKDQTIRIASCVSTELINDIVKFQAMTPLASTLLGRAVTGAVLMASQLKDGQKVGLHFHGKGPMGSLFAEASYDGKARAYCENKGVQLPAGVEKLGFALGEGHLDVVRTLPFQREAHRGSVELYSGEIGEDIAYYLRQSQQVPAIVALSAIPATEEGRLEIAGGYIVELMPGATEETKIQLEWIQSQAVSISRRIRQGNSADDLISPFKEVFDFEPIEHPYTVEHECICSVERMEAALKLLGAKTIKDMIAKARAGAASEAEKATCEFCGKSYQISEEQLELILQELSGQSAPHSVH